MEILPGKISIVGLPLSIAAEGNTFSRSHDLYTEMHSNGHLTKPIINYLATQNYQTEYVNLHSSERQLSRFQI